MKINQDLSSIGLSMVPGTGGIFNIFMILQLRVDGKRISDEGENHIKETWKGQKENFHQLSSRWLARLGIRLELRSKRETALDIH